VYTSATALWLRCYIKCYLIRWVPGTTMYHTRPYDRTQYQSYVIQYITYVVRTRSTFYVLPSAEPSDIGCLQGADASATGFSEKACRYPSLVYVGLSVPGSFAQPASTCSTYSSILERATVSTRLIADCCRLCSWGGVCSLEYS
jgi:hypothetical protein